jgi:hypothetical protein
MPSIRPVMPNLRLPDQRIEIDPTSVALDLGRVRPKKSEQSTRFFLFLLAPPPQENEIRVRWMLNSTSTAGNQEGEVSIPVLSRDDRDLTRTLDLPALSDDT